MSLRFTRTTTSLFIIIPVLIILFALGFLGWKTEWFTKAKRAQYQAVFLTNGQVYFGRVRQAAAPYVIVTDIYYLRSVERLQEPQPVEEGKKGKETPPQETEPELTLVKLGQELHAPEDRMEINRDHILFIEDLREDGKVSEAIKRYKTDNK